MKIDINICNYDMEVNSKVLRIPTKTTHVLARGWANQRENRCAPVLTVVRQHI
jgi:hypothetical protein